MLLKKMGMVVVVTAILILLTGNTLIPDTVPPKLIPVTKSKITVSKQQAIPVTETPDYYRKTNTGLKISKDDYELLARLAHAEAGVDNIQSQIGVINIVLNRIKSGKFQNTVYNVIHAKNQFEVVSNGSINEPANKDNYEAVDRALAGVNTVANCVYFWDSKLSKRNPIWKHGVRFKYSSTVFGGSY